MSRLRPSIQKSVTTKLATHLLLAALGAAVAAQAAQAQTYTTLYTVSGSQGLGAVVSALDSSGNIYGVSQQGGVTGACGGSGCGAVFKLDASNNFTLLYEFAGPPADGEYPNPVTLGANGLIYGTTQFGGTSTLCSSRGCGTVYELNTSGKDKILHNFQGPPDGE